jgi:hypothetical protein
MTDTCDTCGKQLSVSEWPFCPHGFPERPGGVAVIDDSIPGGPRMFENLGEKDVYISSKSQLRAELHARGLRECVRHVGVQGSDKSKETQRWI